MADAADDYYDSMERSKTTAPAGRANLTPDGLPKGKPPGRDSNSWFTPREYIALARKMLGSIDFDPFTSEEANKVVRAAQFYTVKDDAFVKEWPEVETVWMNPPYGRGEITRAIDAFFRNMANFQEAIVLVNSATDTAWFHELISRAAAVCLTNHRIGFYNVDGKSVTGNTRGQAFLYFGPAKSVFTETFASVGFVLDTPAAMERLTYLCLREFDGRWAILEAIGDPENTDKPPDAIMTMDFCTLIAEHANALRAAGEQEMTGGATSLGTTRKIDRK